MLDRFCDQCGEPRIGQFRYCLKCGSDFEGWRGAAAAPEAKSSTGLAAAGQEPDVAQTTVPDPEPTPGQRRRLPVAEAITATVIGAVALLIVYLVTAAIQPPA